MKQATNPRRGRNRSSGKRSSSQSRNRNYDGSGSDNRVRGSSQQILDKYLSLARDASLAGDRIAAEGFHQHAEHYFRVLNPEPGAEGGQGGNQQNRKPRYEKSHTQKHENQPSPVHQQQSSETKPEPVAEVAEVSTPEPVADVAEASKPEPVVEAVETPASEPQADNEEGGQEKPRRRGRPRKVETAEPAA